MCVILVLVVANMNTIHTLVRACQKPAESQLLFQRNLSELMTLTNIINEDSGIMDIESFVAITQLRHHYLGWTCLGCVQNKSLDGGRVLKFGRTYSFQGTSGSITALSHVSTLCLIFLIMQYLYGQHTPPQEACVAAKSAIIHGQLSIVTTIVLCCHCHANLLH